MNQELVLGLLNVNWRPQDGDVDAKSAYYRLKQRDVLSDPLVKFEELTSPPCWVANLSFYTELDRQGFNSTGTGGGKPAAARAAFASGLAQLRMFLILIRLLTTNQRAGIALLNDAQCLAPALAFPTLSSPSEDSDSGYSDNEHTGSSGSSNPPSSNPTSAPSHSSSVSPSVSLTRPPTQPSQRLPSTRELRQIEIGNAEMRKLDDWLASAVQSMPRVVVCIDIEADETSNKILEMGADLWLSEPPPGSTQQRYQRHFVVRENADIVNVHCPQNRDGYKHGRSITIDEAKLMAWTRLLLQEMSPRTADTSVVTPCILVGHTVTNDMRWLSKRSTELRMENKIDFELSFTNVETLDVALVDRAEQQSHQNRALKKIGKAWKVPFEGDPHNAGNDAVHTMELLSAMAQSRIRLPELLACGKKG